MLNDRVYTKNRPTKIFEHFNNYLLNDFIYITYNNI